MPPNSEIEKLERRWKENPKGTVFAPYAEVLRKNGDHLEARDVLRQGLELHPDHIPGNIVLGRCCLDLREDGPAEAAFTHVLDLDPENVIALKALADITERQGRLMEARDWLARLISVDPSNEEARDQLERVDTAREAAAAAITAPLEMESPPSLAAHPRAADITATVEVVARSLVSPPGPSVEIAAGEVTDAPAGVDEAVDAALDRFAPSAARTVETPPPAPPVHLHLDEEDTVPVLPALPREAAPIADLEPLEMDLTEAARDLEPGSLSGLEMDEPFAPPPAPPAAEPPGMFALDDAEPEPLELRPSGSSEFQSPDDSTALLGLETGAAEFQMPDAAAELRLAGAGSSEYQTPSGAEELLSRLDSTGIPEPEPELIEPPPAPSPPPVVPSGPVTTGFAAISLMPTEELSTSVPLGRAEIPAPEAAAPAGERAAVDAEPPAVSVVDQLAAASAPVTVPGDLTPTAFPELEAEAEVEAEAEEPAPGRPSELKLIFPDDAAEPEAPRVRRISQEVRSVRPEPAAAAAPEPALGEPEPVLTESMAELYARQGHLAEALNVYQTLLAQQPNDSRLAERIRQLEQQRATGSRRLSYVAMETGGESVESFFRGLAGARPGGAAGSGGEDVDGGGAPTRPARDPLSLSAIFGEEHAPVPVPTASEPPQRPATPDAFSFDQFFGGPGSGTGTTGPRQAMPTDEDLDQFQHWLKSLKR